LRAPERGRSARPRSLAGACGLSALTLLISWNPVTTTCRGGALRAPIDHYELKIFEMRVIGMTGEFPIYLRSTSRTSTTTSVNVDPPVGGVVGWDNMWSATWTLQSPTVVSVSMTGSRSDQGCP
jgi:hypothetical protein